MFLTHGFQGKFLEILACPSCLALAKRGRIFVFIRSMKPEFQFRICFKKYYFSLYGRL